MDPEERDHFLAPTREQLASVKVFPLIPNLKNDATVCGSNLLEFVLLLFKTFGRLDNYMHTLDMGSADGQRHQLCYCSTTGIQICASREHGHHLCMYGSQITLSCRGRIKFGILWRQLLSSHALRTFGHEASW